jgi:hypothetical protein
VQTTVSEPARLTTASGSTANPAIRRSAGGDSLADVLERVLDKGVVVAGDIGISVLDIELLTLKIRLLIASAETAREMGIDWWESDPFLSSKARDGDEERKRLEKRIAELERRIGEGGGGDGPS